MHIQTEYKYGILLQNITTGLGLFWDDFPKKNPSVTWTHSPTATVISDFWNFFFFAEPLRKNATFTCRKTLARLPSLGFVELENRSIASMMGKLVISENNESNSNSYSTNIE